jgi:hypothetical protein
VALLSAFGASSDATVCQELLQLPAVQQPSGIACCRVTDGWRSVTCQEGQSVRPLRAQHATLKMSPLSWNIKSLGIHDFLSCRADWSWCIVACRPVAKRWLCRQLSLLGNARNNRRTKLPVIRAAAFYRQRLREHVPVAMNTHTTIDLLLETVFSMLSVPRCYNWVGLGQLASNPCGGGVEYLNRDPASRRRRRKGKSQIWDSKIWSRVQRDSDPRDTMSEKPPHKNKTVTVNEQWAQHEDLLIDRPSVAVWLWLLTS